MIIDEREKYRFYWLSCGVSWADHVSRELDLDGIEVPRGFTV